MNPEELLKEAERRGIDTTKYRAKLAQKQALSKSVQIPNTGPAEGIVNSFRTRAGMGPMASTNTTQKLLETILGEQAKSLYADPLDRELKQAKIKAINAGMTTDENGNIIKSSDIARDEKEERLRNFEARRQASTLRGELNSNDYVKRFQAINSAASGLDSILQDTISRPDNTSKNVGDQALITLYNKILDPLSVVRESEYSRTPEGQALLNRIEGYVQKVQSGGSGLTDKDRIEIARAAKVLVNNSGNLYNQKITDYEGLANAYGADPNLVTSGFQKFSPYDIEKQYGLNPEQQSEGAPSVGGVFMGKKIKSVKRIS